MSLDVYLTIEGAQSIPPEQNIPIRENGQVTLITRAEWDKKFPGVEPITIDMDNDGSTAYSANITHNLNKMADAAGIYKYLWRPDELGIKTADELIGPLRKGLALLQGDPEKYKRYNPPNGWGDYEGLVSFVHDYLAACQEYPDAIVSVWR